MKKQVNLLQLKELYIRYLNNVNRVKNGITDNIVLLQGFIVIWQM